MSRGYKATATGAIAIILWGTLALMTRLTEGVIPPFQLMAMTFFIGFLLIGSRWWLKGESGLSYLLQPWPVWLLGISGYFIYHLFYFAAMARAPAVDVSLIAYLWPLLIVLFSALLPGERLLSRHISGAVLALSGCWLIISREGVSLQAEYLPGYLLAAGCALIWSGYSLLSRLINQVSTDVVGWYCLFAALFAALAHSLWEETVIPASSLHWLGILGLGLGPMGLAFFCWDRGVKQGDIQLLGVLSYAAPLISVLLLFFAGMAEYSHQLMLACLAIVAGSLCASGVGGKPLKKLRYKLSRRITRMAFSKR